jgi:MbtH protein
MSNPFDDEAGEFLVLVNHEGQYSLWPSRMSVPAGWNPARAPASRAECLSWIDAHWTAMQPKPAIAAVRGTIGFP